jgi:hypothetical protein
MCFWRANNGGVTKLHHTRRRDTLRSCAPLEGATLYVYAHFWRVVPSRTLRTMCVTCVATLVYLPFISAHASIYVALCTASSFTILDCLSLFVVSDASNIFTTSGCWHSWRVHQMQYGDTALVCASDKGHAECARLLADAGTTR